MPQGAVAGQQGGCPCTAHDEQEDTQLTVNVLHALVNLTSPRGTTTNPVAQVGAGTVCVQVCATGACHVSSCCARNWTCTRYVLVLPNRE